MRLVALAQRLVPGDNLEIITSVLGLRCRAAGRFRHDVSNPRHGSEIAVKLPRPVYLRYTGQQVRL
jgi:hypothetical protein